MGEIESLNALFSVPDPEENGNSGFNLETGNFIVGVGILLLGGVNVAQGLIPRISPRTIIASGISLAILFFVIRFLPENIKSFFRI